MDWLNYHHLYYFWVTAREGSLTRASKKLLLAPSTISTQVRSLERDLGVDLFHRRGKRLVLTERGRRAMLMGDEIFGLGKELLTAMQDPEPGTHTTHLRVGISDILHKWVAHRVLADMLAASPNPVHLVCRSDHPERLAADLATHTLDVVLSDTSLNTREHNLEAVQIARLHAVLVGVPSLIKQYQSGLPNSLAQAPWLLPAKGTTLRRGLDNWLDANDILPHIVAEFTDSAVMKAFGRDGAGIFPIPAEVAEEVCEVYGVEVLGPLEGVFEPLYGLLPAHNHHPLVPVLIEVARTAFAKSVAAE
ncbi:MAG: LysR family transcriptional regulator [Myxococcota bacterium]|nr:LysR family transcriptional regulator [Myxococcota bacterium]